MTLERTDNQSKNPFIFSKVEYIKLSLNLTEYFDSINREQRENYWKHREKARRNPNKYMSLIVDAMDHSKLVIPKFMKKSKETTNLERLRSHLTAVLDHGNDPLAFVGLFQWPHDSNYTINTLLSALEKHEKLPDFLYPQMDNCWRENKNQFVLSFLALLILLGVFTKVSRSLNCFFLPYIRRERSVFRLDSNSPPMIWSLILHSALYQEAAIMNHKIMRHANSILVLISCLFPTHSGLDC